MNIGAWVFIHFFRLFFRFFFFFSDFSRA